MSDASTADHLEGLRTADVELDIAHQMCKYENPGYFAPDCGLYYTTLWTGEGTVVVVAHADDGSTKEFHLKVESGPSFRKS